MHKKLLLYFLSLVSYLLSLFLFPKPVLAVSKEDCFKPGIGNIGCLPFYLSNIIAGVFLLSGIATVILITLSSIRLVLSGSDPIKIEKAKKSIYFSIIGFLIILFSYFILKTITVLTGASCLTSLSFEACK